MGISYRVAWTARLSLSTDYIGREGENAQTQFIITNLRDW
jgi:hypothetical protein